MIRVLDRLPEVRREGGGRVMPLVLDRLPKGWRYLYGATTAPLGYRWACNNKSRFGGEYRHALVKEDR